MERWDRAQKEIVPQLEAELAYFTTHRPVKGAVPSWRQFLLVDQSFLPDRLPGVHYGLLLRLVRMRELLEGDWGPDESREVTHLARESLVIAGHSGWTGPDCKLWPEELPDEERDFPWCQTFESWCHHVQRYIVDVFADPFCRAACLGFDDGEWPAPVGAFYFYEEFWLTCMSECCSWGLLDDSCLRAADGRVWPEVLVLLRTMRDELHELDRVVRSARSSDAVRNHEAMEACERTARQIRDITNAVGWTA